MIASEPRSFLWTTFDINNIYGAGMHANIRAYIPIYIAHKFLYLHAATEHFNTYIHMDLHIFTCFCT